MFAKGRPLGIDGSVEENFSPTETVRRARSQIGKKKGEYNLATNNCEHFARECKSGKAESKQVQKAVTSAVFLSQVRWPLLLLRKRAKIRRHKIMRNSNRLSCFDSSEE